VKFRPAIPKVDKSKYYPLRSEAPTLIPVMLRLGNKSSTSSFDNWRLVKPKVFTKSSN